MAELKRTFTGGKMDKDTDERIVQNGLYREALNISIATSEDSDVGAAQNILGNTKVTKACQYVTQANIDSNSLNPDLLGKNYHVGATIDKQSNKLYRFIHTESSDSERGIWMDRILEFDTSKKINEDWDTKEFAVFVDIFKIKFPINSVESICDNGTGIPNKTLVQMNASGNPLFPFVNQVRWGMRAEDVAKNNMGTVEDVYYNGYDDSGTTVFGFILNKNNTSLGLSPGDVIYLYGDRNLNFGDNTNGLRNITGINIVDDMLYWTDNISEPKKLNIKRSKMGCDSATWQASTGRGGDRIDDFIQHTLLIVDEDNPRDIIIDESTCITEEGCLDPNALNYDATALYDCNGDDPNTQAAGWDSCCIVEIPGCTDQSASNYDANANFNDGSCCYIDGCTDAIACNYNDNACFDDGSCTYAGCQQGCTDSNANNFDATADIDDGTCTYSDVWVLAQDIDCACVQVGANTNINPTFADEASCAAHHNTVLTTGCCDLANVFYGCTDPLATNYFANATCGCNAEVATIQNGVGETFTSDGVGCDPNAGTFCNGPGGNECCVYTVSGCMDQLDANYDNTATTNDPTQCTGVLGCMDPEACNADCATIVNPNSTAPCSDTVTVDDGTCEYGACLGCMDPLAENYNPNATRTDESCTYVPTYECSGLMTCVEVTNGTGGFASFEECDQVCVVPSWDCFSGTCLDPGTGNGQFASEVVCDAACVDPGAGGASTFDCNNGNCIEIKVGDNGYPATFVDLNACQAVCFTESWDCDGQGNCSENFLGTGAFLDVNTCQQYCPVPMSWDCDGQGNCTDPGDGNGTYTDANSGNFFGAGLIDCNAACTQPAPDPWYCNAGVCVQDATSGIYSTEQVCYDNSSSQGCYEPGTVFGCMDTAVGSNADVNGNFDANGNGYYATNYDPNATAPCDNNGPPACDNVNTTCLGPGTAPGDCCDYPVASEFSIVDVGSDGSQYECQETTTGNAIDNITYFASMWDCEDASPYIGCRDKQSVTYNVYADEEGTEPTVNSNKACYYPDATTYQNPIPDGGTPIAYFENQNADLRGEPWTNYTMNNWGGKWDYSGGDHGFSVAAWGNNEYDTVAYTGSNISQLNNDDPDYFYGAPNYARNLAIYVQNEHGVTHDLENGGANQVYSGDGANISGWHIIEAPSHNACATYATTYSSDRDKMHLFYWYAANVFGSKSNGIQGYCASCYNSPADGNTMEGNCGTDGNGVVLFDPFTGATWNNCGGTTCGSAPWSN